MVVNWFFSQVASAAVQGEILLCCWHCCRSWCGCRALSLCPQCSCSSEPVPPSSRPSVARCPQALTPHTLIKPALSGASFALIFCQLWHSLSCTPVQNYVTPPPPDTPLSKPASLHLLWLKDRCGTANSGPAWKSWRERTDLCRLLPASFPLPLFYHNCFFPA